MSFKGMNITVKGRSHEEAGTICQDSSGYAIFDDYAVSIVADGHGSKKHFRSDMGSKFAVQSSLETIKGYTKDFKAFCDAFKRSPNIILNKMQKNIISKWNDRIFKHLEENPITDKEKSPFTPEEFDAIKPESYYGTTLIVGFMCNEFSFGLQLGDGSFVLVNEIGEIEMPIVDDETHPANVTASMCNSNAIELFDSYYTFKQATALMVSTDGLYTSFASRNGFEEYNLLALSILGNDENAESSILSNLEKRTKFGSRDDISLSLVYEEKRKKNRDSLIKISLEHMKKSSKVAMARQKAMIKKQSIKYAQEEEEDEDF